MPLAGLYQWLLVVPPPLASAPNAALDLAVASEQAALANTSIGLAFVQPGQATTLTRSEPLCAQVSSARHLAAVWRSG